MFHKILALYRKWQHDKYMRRVDAFAISQGKSPQEMRAIFSRLANDQKFMMSL